MNLFQQCLPSTLNADYRYQADRRKVVTTVRPVPGGVRLADSKSTAAAMAAAATSAMQMLMMKSSSSSSLSLQSVTGGKENIPLSRKVSGGGGGGGGGGAATTATEVVIDLCAEEESSSRRAPPRKSNPTEPEVIDLCEELPIRRSVPSIAATLLPRKRKLDILREGGLEVTPVASSSGGGGGGGGAVGPSSRSLTISRRLPPASVAISAIASGETSLEVIDPKRSQKNRSNRAPSQILDLRTMRHAHAAAGSEDENSLVKKFSPNLGPNIEISLVGNDAPSSASAASNGGGGGGGGGSVNSLRRDEKKRKSIPLPIPALRKISTGELSVQNLAASEENNMLEPKITLTSRKTSSSDVSFTKAPSKSSSTAIPASSAAAAGAAAAAIGAQMKDNQTTASRLQHVNPSLYLAAFYNSMYPESDSETFISAHDGADSANPYQIQLTQQQISYVKGAFMHQPGQQLDIDTATEAFAQKFTNMLKNGTVSIVENYEKILPD